MTFPQRLNGTASEIWRMLMRFRSDNEYIYTQDFHVGRGLPAGVEFEARVEGSGICLKACGYGCLKRHTTECYGNGSIYLKVGLLTSSQRRRFAKNHPLASQSSAGFLPAAAVTLGWQGALLEGMR